MSRLLATAGIAAGSPLSSPTTWRRLAAYRQAWRPLACALVGLDTGLDEFATVTVADVGPDGSCVTVGEAADRRTIDLPDGAAVFAQAQQLARRFAGAADTDQLFADDDGTPLRTRALANAVRAPMTEVGVAVTHQLSRAKPDAGRWANRWGVSVQALR